MTAQHIGRAAYFTLFYVFIYFLAHPIYYLRSLSFSVSLPRRNLGPASLRMHFSPPLPFGTRLRFYREKSSENYSLVSPRRTVLPHATKRSLAASWLYCTLLVTCSRDNNAYPPL